MAAISQMAQNNPQLQKTLQVIQQNGGDPRVAFYRQAQQMGVDPNMALQQMPKFW